MNKLPRTKLCSTGADPVKRRTGVPYKATDFMNFSASVMFSRRNVLHGIRSKCTSAHGGAFSVISTDISPYGGER